MKPRSPSKGTGTQNGRISEARVPLYMSHILGCALDFDRRPTTQYDDLSSRTYSMIRLDVELKREFDVSQLDFLVDVLKHYRQCNPLLGPSEGGNLSLSCLRSIFFCLRLTTGH